MPYEFQHTRENAPGRGGGGGGVKGQRGGVWRGKSSYSLLTANFQITETLNLPLSHVLSPWQWCPSISTSSQALPWSWEPNATWTLCWDCGKLWSFECKLQSKLLQELPKSLVHLADEKATRPSPRGNLASCRLWGEITATNCWKIQNLFLEEIRATKWGWVFLIFYTVNAHSLLNQSKCIFYWIKKKKKYIFKGTARREDGLNTNVQRYSRLPKAYSTWHICTWLTSMSRDVWGISTFLEPQLENKHWYPKMTSGVNV